MIDWGAVGAAFFPQRCFFCGCVVRYRERVCPECALRLKECEREGIAVRMNLRCTAPYGYRGFVREHLPSIKMRQRRELADWFAPKMADSIRKVFSEERIDLLVCVPCWEPETRQYNQARVLARRVSAALEMPMQDVLVQMRQKERQHTLSAAERLRNVQELYALRDEQALRMVNGASVLLVDDIITTGATLSACAQVLKEAGAVRVIGASAAVTEKT